MSDQVRTDGLQAIYVRPKRFAELTGINERTVYKFIYDGKLRARKVGRTLSIPVSELTDFYDRNDEFANAA